MFLSAAKLSVVLLAATHGAPQMPPKEAAAWKRIQPVTIVLRQGTYVAGRAALIDSRGYFIAHRTSVPANDLEGQTSDGKTYHVVRVALDEPSGLVLLIAQGWSKPGIAPVQIPMGPIAAGTPLLAVIGSGPIESEFVSADRFGVLAPSRRFMPLIEVKFESSQQLVGGALLFDYEGQFLGALKATLDTKSGEAPPPEASSLNSTKNILRGKTENRQSIGPSQLTVAYSAGLSALRAVVDGFKSPTHEVWRPQLGVTCKDAEAGGALVESVIAGSPADKGGIRVGDVIFQIGQTPVHNQVGFARAMLLQTIGADVKVGFLRRGTTMLVSVKLGKSKD